MFDNIINYHIDYKFSIRTNVNEKEMQRVKLITYINEHVNALGTIPLTSLTPADEQNVEDYDITLFISGRVGRADEREIIKNMCLKLVQLLSNAYDVVYACSGYHDDFWFTVYLNNCKA